MKKLVKKLLKIYKEYEEIINYLVIGICTTIVSLGSYYLLTFTILDVSNPLELQLANIISWICAVLFAYITNRKIVFKSKNDNRVVELGKFALSRVSTLLLEIILTFIFVTTLGINDKIFKLIDQVIIMVLNYLLSKLFVFKKS